MCEVNENETVYNDVTSDEACVIFLEKLVSASEDSQMCKNYYKILLNFFRKRSKKKKNSHRRFKATITTVN